MSSRRSFLGAAAAALSLPATGVGEADPSGSTPGDAEPDHTSSPRTARASGHITARTDVEAGDGSVTVRSIRFTRPGGPTYQAELVVAAHPIRLTFAVDDEAARQLRDTLRGERPDGHLGGDVEMFAECAPGAEGSLSVKGDRFHVVGEGVEAIVLLDETLRAEVVDGLDAALAEPVTVED